MKAREFPQQKSEGGIGVRVLTRMTSLGIALVYYGSFFTSALDFTLLAGCPS